MDNFIFLLVLLFAMDLTKKKCVPCEGSMPPMEKGKVNELLKEVPSWSLNNNGHLSKRFEFKNFVEAMGFLNKVAKIAEKEGHHPDFSVHYRKVDFEIWTHAINGLSENDFILAAKIDQLQK
jgi:4a-hydroxytetrahydrobiopterin dehydratase